MNYNPKVALKCVLVCICSQITSYMGLKRI